MFMIASVNRLESLSVTLILDISSHINQSNKVSSRSITTARNMLNTHLFIITTL